MTELVKPEGELAVRELLDRASARGGQENSMMRWVNDHPDQTIDVVKAEPDAPVSRLETDAW